MWAYQQLCWFNFGSMEQTLTENCEMLNMSVLSIIQKVAMISITFFCVVSQTAGFFITAQVDRLQLECGFYTYTNTHLANVDRAWQIHRISYSFTTFGPALLLEYTSTFTMHSAHSLKNTCTCIHACTLVVAQCLSLCCS